MAEPTTGPRSESEPPKCKLCGGERTGGKFCHDCQQAIHRATGFCEEHCKIPARYRRATSGRDFGTSGLLFTGLPGTGKTWEAFGLISKYRQQDPRLFLAAYTWVDVLLMLRRGFSDKDYAEPAQEVIEALRSADIALIDDLGAEKATEGNRAWLQETLYGIIDHRYNWERTTILTTNLPGDRLAEYLGDRLASRILGMCEVVELKGKDRRLG